GKSLPVGSGKTKQVPYTTTVTGSIDFVMDVNGGKKPNSEVATRSRDIRSFKSAKFSKGAPDCNKYANSFYVEDVGCIVRPPVGNSRPISEAPYSACTNTASGGNCNYWAGLKAECVSLNNMHLASLDELNKLYKRKCSSSSNPDYNADTCISDIPTTGEFYSSKEYDTYDAWSKNFANGNEIKRSKRNIANILCVGN
ncbi:hypothetical protein J6P92_00110, partial [bacterium]|nr:hypothetical protein [bacterium]